MTLGETICALRARRNLSQGDLAERLGVSRQSVSKWETNASVPDLDKLVRLSETFGVTLDELVHGPSEPSAQSAEPPIPPPQSSPARTPARNTIWLFLLGVGAFLIVLLTFMGSLEAGIMISLPFLLCAVLCMVVKWRHIGLCCLWVLWLMVMAYLHYATVIRPWWVLSPWLYRPEMLTHLLVAWAEVLTFIALATATVWRIRKGWRQ